MEGDIKARQKVSTILSAPTVAKTLSTLMITPAMCSGITKLAASPEDQIAAFATAGNKIYTMSLQLEPARDFLRPSQVVVKGRMDPVKSLVWNSRTRCLMAAVGSSVVVFKSPKRLA